MVEIANKYLANITDRSSKYVLDESYFESTTNAYYFSYVYYCNDNKTTDNNIFYISCEGQLISFVSKDNEVFDNEYIDTIDYNLVIDKLTNHMKQSNYNITDLSIDSVYVTKQDNKLKLLVGAKCIETIAGVQNQSYILETIDYFN